MLYARGPLRTLQLAAVLALAHAASARPSSVFERAGTCAADYEQCSQTGLPENFCCSAGSTCNVLAGNTTVLCCPEGGDCTTIKTISCDVSLQDPEGNPTAAVKTTELDGKLPVCGKGCCPFGYHCDEDSTNCVADEDQSQKPGESADTPVSTSTAPPSPTASGGTQSTSTGTTTSTSTSTGAPPIPTETMTTSENAGGKPAQPTETSSPEAAATLNTTAIVGGAVGGLVGLSLIIAGIWLLRYKRRKNDGDGEKRDTDISFGNIISAPIPHADYHTQRLDFLAKAQGSSASPTTGPGAGSPRGPGPFPPSSPYSAYAFRPGSEMTDPPRSHHTSAEVGGLRNLTGRFSQRNSVVSNTNPNPNPHPNLNRYTPSRYSIPNPFSSARSDRMNSGGSESINIFADPSVGSPSVYNRRDTTWTDFQDHADRPNTGTDHPPLPRER